MFGENALSCSTELFLNHFLVLYTLKTRLHIGYFCPIKLGINVYRKQAKSLPHHWSRRPWLQGSTSFGALCKNESLHICMYFYAWVMKYSTKCAKKWRAHCVEHCRAFTRPSRLMDELKLLSATFMNIFYLFIDSLAEFGTNNFCHMFLNEWLLWACSFNELHKWGTG